MLSFACLRTSLFTFGDYRIEPYRKKDLNSIREWRNEQMDVLRQNRLLTEEDQTNYYQHVILPTFSLELPRMILFSYIEGKTCIGYGGLTNIDWDSRRAEISFLVSTARAHNEAVYEMDFSVFLRLMKQVAFDELYFNRLFTETYDIRPYHIGILERSGFRLEGRMKQHVSVSERLVDSLIHGCLKEYYDAEK